ncbi:MAG: zeta toxin family protein [Acidobacteria bacterium]|nr:zeta toxin family protein [Acidobacteriota bacterium]
MRRDKIIYVIKDGERMPFLRGIMVQSLMDLGLSFDDAYKVATLVRDELERKGKIKANELKKRVASILKERFGKNLAERYLRGKEVPTPILVEGVDLSIPFSKGILSQSILASGLDYSRAYEAAMEIESYLIREGVRRISRHKLRNLAYDTIKRKYGEEYAERYLVWRKYQLPEKPVIILIGGATGAGKTSLSAEVAHRMGIIRMISTDSVRQIMRIMFSQELLPSIHSSSYDAWKDLVYPLAEESDPVIVAFREQAIRVSVGVKALIDRAVEENYNMIIDGVHLVPGLVNWDEYRNKAHIIPLVVVVLEKDHYRQRFLLRQQIAPTRQFERYLANFDSILKIQDYIIERAEQEDVPIVNNLDFEHSVRAIIRIVAGFLLRSERRVVS